MSVLNDNLFKELVYRSYIDRYKEAKLFEIDSNIPMMIIRFYLESEVTTKVSEKVYMNFKAKYILSENELEGVSVSKTEVNHLVHNDPIKHTKEEVLGLADVYEYINNYAVEKIGDLSIFELLNIRAILFSHTPHSEYSRRFRNCEARISGSEIKLAGFYDILPGMCKINHEFKRILKKSKNIEEFILSSIRLHIKLLIIHPFPDGNGRSMRALFNLLMKYIGLPPMYVKLEEKEKYCEAIETAILEKNTKKIEKFFLFKIANAIIENDEEFSSEAIKIL